MTMSAPMRMKRAGALVQIQAVAVIIVLWSSLSVFAQPPVMQLPTEADGFIQTQAEVNPMPVSGDFFERGYEVFIEHRVLVTHIGIYDHNADGINGTLFARLWVLGRGAPYPNTTIQSDLLIDQVVFNAADPGIYRAGYRFKPLNAGPVQFYQGDRIVVTGFGWSPNDPYANSTGMPGFITNVVSATTGSQIISYYYARGGGYPAPPPPNPSFAATAPPRTLLTTEYVGFESFPTGKLASTSLLMRQISDFVALSVPAGSGNMPYVQFYKHWTMPIPYLPEVHLGPRFTVNHPLVVTHLGVFDANSDGIAGTLNVTLWHLAKGILATVLFTSDSPGDLEPGTSMRWKALPAPIRLTCMGSGWITVSGNTAADPYMIVEGDPQFVLDHIRTASSLWRYDMGDDALVFTSMGFYGYPTPDTMSSPAVTFAGGSFRYQQIMGRFQTSLNTHILIPKTPIPIYESSVFNAIPPTQVLPTCICVDKRGWFYVGSPFFLGVFDNNWKLAHQIAIMAPFACVVDDDLSVYVSSLARNRVLKFDQNGAFLSAFGSGAPGGVTKGVNDLNNVRAITLARGSLWVQDSYNSSTLVYNKHTTQLVDKIGGKIVGGLAPASVFSQSESLTVGGNENYLYAGDIFGNRVIRFDLNRGEWSRFDNGQIFGAMWGLAYSDNLRLVATGEFDDTKVQLLNQCGETVGQASVRAHKMTFFGNMLYTTDNLNSIGVFEVACRPGFYGLDCDREVEPCDPIGGTSNGGIFGDGKCVCKSGYSGADCSFQFARQDLYTTFKYFNPMRPDATGDNWNPFGITQAPDGTIYVTSVISGGVYSTEIQQFTRDGVFIRSFGKPFNVVPKAIQIDVHTGDIFVGAADGITIYGQDGSVKGMFASSPFGQLDGRTALVLDQVTKKLYTTMHGLIGTNMPGYVISIDLMQPPGPNQFYAYPRSLDTPQAVALYNGELYTIGVGVIQKWDSANSIWLNITFGIFNENYASSQGGGLWVTEDRIYATEGLTGRLTIFSKDGTILSRWGGNGVNDPNGQQVSFANPKGLVLDPTDGTMFVADSGNNRIVVLKEQFGCVEGFYGQACTKCDCPRFSVCNDTIEGDGTCTCTDNFDGPNCDVCQPGFYIASGPSCARCPPGTFSANGTTCEACPIGHYSQFTGLSECIKCPPGKYSAIEGQTECNSCEEGKYSDIEGVTACMSCRPGTFASVRGHTVCTLCNSQMYTNQTESQFCEMCPSFSHPTDNRTECVCNAGYYPTAHSGPGTISECGGCPVGGDCSSGVLRTAPGYWRQDTDSLIFYPCPNSESCLQPALSPDVPSAIISDSSSSDPIYTPPTQITNLAVVCAEGYTGKLCAVCEDGYYHTNGGSTCSVCPTAQVNRGAIAGIAILIVVLVILLFCKTFIIAVILKIVAKIKGTPAQSSEKVSIEVEEFHNNNNEEERNNKNDEFADDNDEKKGDTLAIQSNEPPFMSVFKSVTTFLQIISQIGVIYAVPWPRSYSEVNTNTNFINLDIFNLARIECIGSRSSTNYFALLLMLTLVPIALLILMAPITWLVTMIAKGCGIKKAIRISRFAIIRNILALAFVVYTGVSTKVLQIFDCQEFSDGTYWLKADYSIECYTPLYNKYLIYSIFMIIVYPVGLPLLSVIFIWANSHRLEAKKVVESVGLLYKDFKRGKTDPRITKYWEVIYMIRKLLLTALITYIARSTVWQVGIATFISVVVLVLHLMAEPYLSKDIYNLELCSLLVIAFSFFISIFIRFGNLTTSENEGLTILILIIEMFYFVFAVFTVGKFIHQKIKAKKVSP